MTVWAIADLHLAISTPEKKMDVFGPPWIDYMQKIERNWKERVRPSDLVLVAGDITWALHLEQAKVDLEWIDRLPGTKVILRGNHDYWWSSLNKIEQILPPSIHLIQNNRFDWNDFTIGGARLWDTPEYSFKDYIEYKERPANKKPQEKELSPQETEKIFLRELGRLEASLKSLNPEKKNRIAMTHYPPIGALLNSSRASELLEKYRVNICVFGHLHNVRSSTPFFGQKNGIRYFLTSADYLHFTPLQIA